MAMARANSEGLGVSPMVRVAGSGPITRHSQNFAGETKNRRSDDAFRSGEKKFNGLGIKIFSARDRETNTSGEISPATHCLPALWCRLRQRQCIHEMT